MSTSFIEGCWFLVYVNQLLDYEYAEETFANVPCTVTCPSQHTTHTESHTGILIIWGGGGGGGIELVHDRNRGKIHYNNVSFPQGVGKGGGT